MAYRNEQPCKRRHQRAVIQSNVTFRGESYWQTCHAENISEGGIFIRALPKDTVGTEADLEFEIPNKDMPVMAKGEVVWCEKDENESVGCGMKFTRLYRLDRQLIQEFIAEKGKQPC